MVAGPADLDALDARRAALRPTRAGAGYGRAEVDAFLDRAIESLRALLAENEGLRAGVPPTDPWWDRPTRLTPFDVQDAVFPLVRFGRAYRMRPVDELLDEMTDLLSRLSAENQTLRGSTSAAG